MLFIYFLGFYIYPILDVLDGKQARNLKVSSPLGQLLDHGLDGSVNSLSIVIGQVIMSSITDAQSAFILQIAIQGVFFLGGWNEHYTGVLRTHVLGFGTVEISHIQYLLLILTSIKGYEI